MQLDRSKPYAEIRGGAGRASFEQGGVLFDTTGAEVVTLPLPAVMLPSVIDDIRLGALRAMAESVPAGCFVEVGVYMGGSASVLYDVAQRHKRKLFLYDTFAGMPFKGAIDSHPVGDFADCNLDRIRETLPDAVICQGVFPASMVKMPRIAFVHADADQYQSTKDICLHLGPLMVKGGLMLFDDYRGLNSCIEAVDECFPQREVLERDGRALVRF